MDIKTVIADKVLKIRVDHFFKQLRKINSMKLPIVNIIPKCEEVKTGKHTTVITKNDYIRSLLTKTSPAVLNAISSEDKIDMGFLSKEIFLFNDEFDFNERCEFNLSNFSLCGDALTHNQFFINATINNLIWAEKNHVRNSKTGKFISLASIPEEFFKNQEFASLYAQIEQNHEPIVNKPAIDFEKIKNFE